MALAILLAAVHTRAQAPSLESPPGPFVAFRIDDRYVVAVVRVIGIPDVQQVRSGLSQEPAARYGFAPFDVPATWESHRPRNFVPGDRWIVHAGAGPALAASAERVVAGELGCENAFGVLLRIEDDREFSSTAAKYVVAERGGVARDRARPTTVGAVSTAAVDAHVRARIERALDDVLREGLRAQRMEEAGDVLPQGTREWLESRQAIDTAMANGRGKLTYDVQVFRLGPDPTRQYFVRAKWIVGSNIGFAASIWLRDDADGALRVFASNRNPARFLRMREFRGQIRDEHQGLVLNVVDRDGDGWADVLMAFGGYEGVQLSLRRYSGSGFEDTGIGYGFGC